MPTIAFFYGIAIRMYYSDHPPPHFLASYGGHEANVAIATGEVIDGYLPGRAAGLVRDWTRVHRAELDENWRRAREHVSLRRIAGLDEE